MAGQGLVLGAGGLAPAYEGAGNIDMAHGSMAFWMRPLDWDNLTRYSPFDAHSPAFIELFHITGDFPAGQGPPRWKGPAPVLRFLIIQNMETAVDPLEISPAAWHHVTVTWDMGDVRYYVDGRPAFVGVPERQAPFSIDTPDNDYWVDAPKGVVWRARAQAQAVVFNSYPGGLWHPYWYVRAQDPHTLIDDFRIYRRALSPAEVSNLVALTIPVRRRNRCRKRR